MESNTNESQPFDVSHTLDVCVMMLNGCKDSPIRISNTTTDEDERNDLKRYCFSCQCILIAYCVIKSIMEYEDTASIPEPFLQDLDVYAIREFAGLAESCTITIISLTNKYEDNNDTEPASINFGNPLNHNIRDVLAEIPPTAKKLHSGVTRMRCMIGHLERMKQEHPEKWGEIADDLIPEWRKVLMLYRASAVTMMMPEDKYDDDLSSLRSSHGDILAVHYTYDTAKRMEEDMNQRALECGIITADELHGLERM